MSGFIPMVSSSPPPIDDGGGFDDWGDDDEFGTFTGAEDSGDKASWTSPQADDIGAQAQTSWTTPQADTKTGWDGTANSETDLHQTGLSQPGVGAGEDFGNFANFVESEAKRKPEATRDTYSESVERTSSSGKPATLDIKYNSGSFGLSESSDSVEGEKTMRNDVSSSHQTEASRGSLTDSGMCSTDQSPVPQSEDISDCSVLPQSEDTSDFSPLHKSEERSDSSPVLQVDDDLKDSGVRVQDSDEEISPTQTESGQTETNDSISGKSESASSSLCKVSDKDEGVNVSMGKDLQAESATCSGVSSVNEEEEDWLDFAESECGIKSDQATGEVQSLSVHTVSCINSSQAPRNTQDETESKPLDEVGVSCEHNGDLSSVGETEQDGQTWADEANNISQTGSVGEEILNTAKCETMSEDMSESAKDSEDDIPKVVGEESQDEVDSLDFRTGSVEDLDDKSLASDLDKDTGSPSLSALEEGELSDSASASKVAIAENVDEARTSDQKMEGEEVTENDDFDDFQDFSSATEQDQENVHSISKDAEDVDVQDSVQMVRTSAANFEEDAAKGQEEKESDEEFGDFGDFNSGDNTDFGEFSSGSKTIVEPSEDFGDFSQGETVGDSEKSDGWAAFSSGPSASQSTGGGEDGWGAVTETPQLATASDNLDDDDEFQGAEEPLAPVHSVGKMDKTSRVMAAVDACFPNRKLGTPTKTFHEVDSILHSQRDGDDERLNGDVWLTVCKRKNALAYQWSQSKWNRRLFNTLKIDTQNILFGHKKQSLPVFASNLTLLEPTKGPVKPTIKTEVTLVDTNKVNTTQNITQEIPPAQFDWSSSGLTNPLEASNKTLNLDFLIQEAESSNKSNAFESEFLSSPDRSIKPAAIQPLENILANMKSSSTYKPTNQSEELSSEASRIIKSLPLLSFMNSKVLMFPLRDNNN